MRHAIVVLFCATLGCASTTATPVAVRYDDGVDKQEAKVIARDYLRVHMAASFNCAGPYDEGSMWRFAITGDVAPVELPSIPPLFVDKATGAVTWDARAPLKR